MTSFLGIQYNSSPQQTQANSQFVASLNPAQRQERQVAGKAWKSFESELTPEQHAAQQKWQLEKMEGAPPSVWQKDRQAFLASLSPQEQADRSNAVQLQQTFLQTLSPEQQALRQNFLAARDQAILSTLGLNPGSGNTINFAA